MVLVPKDLKSALVVIQSYLRNAVLYYIHWTYLHIYIQMLIWKYIIYTSSYVHKQRSKQRHYSGIIARKVNCKDPLPYRLSFIISVTHCRRLLLALALTGEPAANILQFHITKFSRYLAVLTKGSYLTII